MAVRTDELSDHLILSIRLGKSEKAYFVMKCKQNERKMTKIGEKRGSWKSNGDQSHAIVLCWTGYGEFFKGTKPEKSTGDATYLQYGQNFFVFFSNRMLEFIDLMWHIFPGRKNREIWEALESICNLYIVNGVTIGGRENETEKENNKTGKKKEKTWTKETYYFVKKTIFCKVLTLVFLTFPQNVEYR